MKRLRWVNPVMRNYIYRIEKLLDKVDNDEALSDKEHELADDVQIVLEKYKEYKENKR
jgi:hypothetical protein